VTVSIPKEYHDLLTGRNYGHLATLMPGGQPQVSPVWVDFDGEYLLVNTAEGRQKARNLDRDARVALSVHDQQQPERYLQVRGVVAERTTIGAVEHINRLSQRYNGRDYAVPEGQVRVIYKIRPLRIQGRPG
jgi:PPOX class probable F420-dependent enzyme